MTPGVQQALAEIQRVFDGAQIAVEEDRAGGAYVVISPVEIGPKYTPDTTWIGGHLPPQLPYSDIYPLFISNEVRRVNGVGFSPPIQPVQPFRGHPALQISRRSNRFDPNLQTAASKFLKVIHWLKTEA